MFNDIENGNIGLLAAAPLASISIFEEISEGRKLNSLKPSQDI